MPGTEPPTLITADDTLRLRPVRLSDDIAPAVTWYHDPEVLRLTQGEGTPPFDAVMVERMFQIMSTRCEVFIIEVREDETWHPIGDASLCATAGTPITIGDAHHRSRGLGRQVLNLLIARAWNLGWPAMVVSGVYTDNPRARRLYEGAGFRITGTIPAEADRSQWTMELRLAD